MPLGNRPRFSEVRSFFNGPANLAAYVRGGAYVPNIPANNAISTTVAGLRLSQFSGAELSEPAVALTPGNPTIYLSAIAYSTGAVGAWIGFDVLATGWVRSGDVSTPYGNRERWATTNTTSYSVRMVLVSGTANDFAQGTFNTWQAITSNTGGPSCSMSEHFSNVAKTVLVRLDFALTSNTAQVLKSITISMTVSYQSDGGGVIN